MSDTEQNPTFLCVVEGCGAPNAHPPTTLYCAMHHRLDSYTDYPRFPLKVGLSHEMWRDIIDKELARLKLAAQPVEPVEAVCDCPDCTTAEPLRPVLFTAHPDGNFREISLDRVRQWFSADNRDGDYRERQLEDINGTLSDELNAARISEDELCAEVQRLTARNEVLSAMLTGTLDAVEDTVAILREATDH